MKEIIIIIIIDIANNGVEKEGRGREGIAKSNLKGESG